MMHLRFELGGKKPKGQILLRSKEEARAADRPNPTIEDNFKDVNLSNWRDKLKTSRQRNLYALKESILTDVTFEVGPNNVSFRAHKYILALGSLVFEAMFFGGLAEKGDSVAIPDIAPEGFEVLLKYLYSDEASFKDEDQGFKAWIAADKYCVSSLKEECVRYLASLPLSSSNIWRMLENCLSMEETTLIDTCLEYLKTSPETIFTSEGFLDTSMETVKRVLLLDSLNVSELVLLKCLVAWGKNRVTTEEFDSLQEALEPLLRHVRFGALSSSDFCSFLDETSGLISDTDALTILKHLTEPLSHPLPGWCCDITWRRRHLPRSIQYSGARPSKKQRIDADDVQINPTPNFLRRFPGLPDYDSGSETVSSDHASRNLYHSVEYGSESDDSVHSASDSQLSPISPTDSSSFYDSASRLIEWDYLDRGLD